MARKARGAGSVPIPVTADALLALFLGMLGGKGAWRGSFKVIQSKVKKEPPLCPSPYILPLMPT